MKIISEIQRFNGDKRLNKLNYLYERNSFLDSLSISRREMSHSSFLADLLKEDSFHELGSLPLQLFLETVLRRAIMQNTRLIEKPCKEVMFPSLKSAILSGSLSLSDIDVNTEVSFRDKNDNSGRVDIMVSCRTKPLPRENGKDVEFLNIIIENKIYAKEQDRQTDKYYNHFNAFLKNNASDKVDVSTRKAGPRALYNLYVYLTPASPAEIDQLKQPESNCKECVQICYQDLLDYVIDPLLESPNLSARGRFYLEEYRRSLGVSFDKIEVNDITKAGKKQLTWKTTIMAIGNKESEELCQFWNDHLDLLTAAVNEKNSSEDDEDDDDPGKRTLYDYKGQPFSMGRLVQAVIIDHLPDYEVAELNDLFKDIVGSIVTTQAKANYFEETCDVRTKDLCTVCIFKQWSEKGPYKFSDFCKKAKELGWYEMKEFKKSVLSAEESMILVDFYNKHEKLITTMMEVIRRSSRAGFSESVEALTRRTASHRDRTTYSVTLHSNNRTLRKLSRGKLVLAVLRDYITQEDCTKEKLLSTFNLPKNALKEYHEEKEKGMSGFFANESEWLKLDDGDYMVAIGWKANDLKNFIEAASALLYDINSSELENK